MEEVTFGQMMMQQVVPQLVTLVGIVLAAGIVWLKSKTAKMIRETVKSEAIQKALLWVNGQVMDLVSEASQTTVRDLKKSLADGRITHEEYKRLLADLKREMISKLHAQTLGRLLGSGAVTSEVAARNLLSSKIEAAVPLAKATQAAANGKGKPADPPQG